MNFIMKLMENEYYEFFILIAIKNIKKKSKILIIK